MREITSEDRKRFADWWHGFVSNLDPDDFVKLPVNHTDYYETDPDAPNEDGGYLIPNRVDYPIDGFAASFWRAMGKVFHRDDWYRRGVKVTYPFKEIMNLLAENRHKP